MQFDFVRSARLGTASLLVGLGAVALAGARIAEPGTGDNHRSAEVQRLGAHFDSVDSELRARDVSRLNSSQLTQRKQLIAWLVEYRNAGVFPVNDRFPGRMVPFFRDSKGTLCAMASVDPAAEISWTESRALGTTHSLPIWRPILSSPRG